MLRVRAGNTYAMPFVVNLGQRNAEIINGHLTPLRRILPSTVAFTLVRSKYDLIHSMNAIPLFARVPFIITFEDWMPRTPPDIRLGALERLLTRIIAQKHCVALIAMSQFAKSQMMMQQQGSPYYANLLAKTEVIYPAVTPGTDRPKKLGKELRLLFVGADFMRKGLPALTTAHIELERRRVPVKTTVVSSLRWKPNDYIGPKSERLVQGEKERLAQSTVTVLGSQSNDAVLRLMQEHDFLVLPTFHDTFGFAVLEAMAMGTPVIATETCAIPEIIGGHNGMLLSIPTDGIGRWQWLYNKKHRDYDYEYVSQVARMGRTLVDHLSTIWHEPERYTLMSLAAQVTIENRFNRLRAREELEKLYDRATRIWA